MRNVLLIYAIINDRMLSRKMQLEFVMILKYPISANTSIWLKFCLYTNQTIQYHLYKDFCELNAFYFIILVYEGECYSDTAVDVENLHQHVKCLWKPNSG